MPRKLMIGRAHALVLLLASVGGAPARAAEAGPWSAPATLGSCSGNGAPHVVFPSDSPDHATGPGAIVWSASSACPGGEGARVAAIGVADVPGTPAIPAAASGRQIAPRGALNVSAGPHGRIVIAGRSGPAADHAVVIQGRADGPFSDLGNVAGDLAPVALATGYLGDVALASPAPAGASGEALGVSVERFFTQSLAPRSATSAWSAGSPGPLAVALDYRTDALTVWAQGGSLWAHDIPASGAPQPVQRLAAVAPGVHIAALLSDDNRATVAWAQERAGLSSVYVERSAVGVRFSAPKLLESFRNPAGLSDPPGSPQLVRLSSESVMMAWAGAAAGRWVVHTTAIDLRGTGTVATLAAPGGDALLTALAPGPDDDAIMLWSEPSQSASGAPDMSQQALFVARGTDIYPDTTAFGAPEQIAPPGPYSNATVAFDPASGRAVASWQGPQDTLQFSVRNPPNGAL
jgi:hypothetical protein